MSACEIVYHGPAWSVSPDLKAVAVRLVLPKVIGPPHLDKYASAFGISTAVLQLEGIRAVMPARASEIAGLQKKIWSGSIPLEIRLAASECRTYDECDPYIVQCSRLSYLPFLFPKVLAFFRPNLIDPGVESHAAWLSFQEVPLKWNYPLGLLYDLFSGAEPISPDRQRPTDTVASQMTVEAVSGSTPLPWRLTIHFTDYPSEQLIQLDRDGRQLLDSYINAVKEADFIRNGTARTVMSLSKADSDKLWTAVQTHDLGLFNTVNNKLLDPPGVELRNAPIRIYLPTSATDTASASEAIPEDFTKSGHIRVVQTLVALQLSSKQPQTLGTALNSVLPSIFPSRRSPLLAQPVLHGAVAPMSAHLGELYRAAAYTDGFLHLAVVMLS